MSKTSYPPTKIPSKNEQLQDSIKSLKCGNTETRSPYTPQTGNEPAYLGTHNQTAYYFHYRKTEKTTLDYQFLSKIQTKTDAYLIYADTCLLSPEELSRYNITFKKIPRDITKL